MNQSPVCRSEADRTTGIDRRVSPIRQRGKQLRLLEETLEKLLVATALLISSYPPGKERAYFSGRDTFSS